MSKHVFTPIHWYTQVYTGIRGSTLDTPGIYTPTQDLYIAYTLVYAGIHVYIQVYKGIQRNTRVCTEKYGRTHVNTCIQMCTRVYTSITTHT